MAVLQAYQADQLKELDYEEEFALNGVKELCRATPICLVRRCCQHHRQHIPGGIGTDTIPHHSQELVPSTSHSRPGPTDRRGEQYDNMLTRNPSQRGQGTPLRHSHTGGDMIL